MASRRPVNRVTPRAKPAPATGSRVPMRFAALDMPHWSGGSRRREADESAMRHTRVAGAAAESGRAAAAARPAPLPSRSLSRRLRPSGVLGSGWRQAAAALIAAVLLGGFAVIAALRPGVDDSNLAFVDTKATEEVTAAAEHALRTIYAYDVHKLDGYKDAVRQVVTGQMLVDFDKFADTNISALKQAQTSADALAEPIGVTMLTDNRAELLVNFVVSATKNGIAQESASGPIVLKMDKVEGRWLASAIMDR